MDDEKKRELAIRFLCAVGSYKMHIKSMDYYRKRYFSETGKIGSFWMQLAELVDTYELDINLSISIQEIMEYLGWE